MHIHSCHNFKKQEYWFIAESAIHIQLHSNNTYDTRFRFSTKEPYIQHMSTWCTGIGGVQTQGKDRKPQQFIIMPTVRGYVRAYIYIYSHSIAICNCAGIKPLISDFLTYFKHIRIRYFITLSQFSTKYSLYVMGQTKLRLCENENHLLVNPPKSASFSIAFLT